MMPLIQNGNNTMRLSVQEALEKAVDAHRSGRLKDADEYYTAILNVVPDHPDANHNIGLLAMKVGKNAEAKMHFQRALDRNPSIPQYWESYINLLITLGEVEEAKALREKASLQRFPNESNASSKKSFQSVQGDLEHKAEHPKNIQKISGKPPLQTALKMAADYAKDEKFEDAIVVYNKVLEKFPKNKVALSGKKKCHAKLNNSRFSQTHKKQILLENIKQDIAAGKSRDVISRAHGLVNMYPSSAQLHNLIAIAHANEKMFERAIDYYEKSLEINPSAHTTYNNYGSLFNELGDAQKAISQYKKAIELEPNYSTAHNNLGKAHKRLADLDEAKLCFERAVFLDGCNYDAYNNLANVFQEQGDSKNAILNYKKVVALRPDFVEAYSNLALALMENDQKDEAKLILEDAIKIRPNFGHLHLNLAQLTKYSPDSWHLDLMLKILKKKEISEDDKAQIQFSIGKAYEDIGDFSASFDHYSTGNKIRASQLVFNPIRFLRLCDRLQDISETLGQNISDYETRENDVIPIFILGMPRSGTTLVEQIISSHRDVTGAGELTYVQKLSQEFLNSVRDIDTRGFNWFRRSYLDQIKSHSDGKLYVTDKMPQNFLYIPFIVKAFPDAKIIHVQREPKATCWSNFKHYFAAEGLSYSYNLSNLVLYYNAYIELMETWQKHYPKKIINLSYEALTGSQLSETKRLIKELGIGWDENCLNPEKNIRFVNTASKMQVKKKVYKDSSLKWRGFETYVASAFADLHDHRN